MKQKLIIFGIGEIGELAKFYFDNDSNFETVAFTLDEEFIKENHFSGLPVYSFGNLENYFNPEDFYIFIAIGYSKMNRIRESKYNQALSKGFKLASYISSKATIFQNCTIGSNCFILEDNTIQPFVKIGDNVTLWSGNHIGHHTLIKDNCFITSQVVISGGVEISENCFVGVNSTIRDRIKIGSFSLIGAGSLILKSIEPNGVYLTKGTERSKVPSNRIRSI